MKHGEIRWYKFNRPDGKRPVLILTRDCAVNCDHLQTVSKGKIGALITSLPQPKMHDVGRAIRFALNLG
jgi:mRNA interferase MazF